MQRRQMGRRQFIPLVGIGIFMANDAATAGVSLPRIASGKVISGGGMSVEEALSRRRSLRNYSGGALTIGEATQLLWAAQGVTDPRGFRTAPSAGALYPLELYLVAGEIDGLDAGIYTYAPRPHVLEPVATGDVRRALARAALGQGWVATAPAAIAFLAVYDQTTRKYGERGVRYAHMEAGNATQNVYLQASALGLGTVVVGAFNDNKVRELLQAPDHYQPLAIMPVGRI